MVGWLVVGRLRWLEWWGGWRLAGFGGWGGGVVGGGSREGVGVVGWLVGVVEGTRPLTGAAGAEGSGLVNFPIDGSARPQSMPRAPGQRLGG